MADFIKYNFKPTAYVRKDLWKPGDTLKQPELANTLKRIRDEGLKRFYEGQTAKLIVEEMQRGNGLISFDDLKNYVVKERKPIELNYINYHVISFPPQSSGGICLLKC